MNNSILNYHLKKFLTELLLKSKSFKSEKEITPVLISFNELISEKKEIKDDIKRQSSLIENLKFEHNELQKRHQYIKSNVLLTKSNELSTKAKEIKSKIKWLFAEMYYNKELVESTQLKIDHQVNEINHYAMQYPELRHEISKINKRIRPIYDKQLEKQNSLLAKQLTELENENRVEEMNCMSTIKAQENQVKILKSEIDDLSRRWTEVMKKTMNKRRNGGNDNGHDYGRTVILTKPLCSIISSASSKRITKDIEKDNEKEKGNESIYDNRNKKRIIIKRQLSIEAKTKRKPFSNFIFISTDPFLIGL